MKEVFGQFFGLIEALILSGLISWGGAKGIEWLYLEVRKETFRALMQPTPSLSDFTQKLTSPSRK